MRLLLIDNHDSFTWNLAQYFQELGVDLTVRLNDEVSVDAALAPLFDAVVISPGPGRPEDSGITLETVKRCCVGRTPLLGVCLGHQAIVLAFGGRVVRHRAVHGHATAIHHTGTGLFRGLPPGVPMTRYHSLAVDSGQLPACLAATAWSDDGAIMGIAHRTHRVFGVQFHPESVLSGDPGMKLLANFVSNSTYEAVAVEPVRKPATTIR